MFLQQWPLSRRTVNCDDPLLMGQRRPPSKFALPSTSCRVFLLCNTMTDTLAPRGRNTSRHANSKTVAVSTLWNLAGRAGPMLVALATTPVLIHELGPTRWGIFAIALALVGAFGVLDFGIGRALTRALAEHIGAGTGAEAATLVKSGLILLSCVGLVMGLAAAGLAYWWASYVVDVTPALRHEILVALLVLCMAVPLVVLNAALWGVIAAHQRFRSANLNVIPITVMYYIGPILILQVYDNLEGVMAALLLCRVAMTFAFWRICVHAMPSLRAAGIDLRLLRPLLRIGGWMTVSNILFPVLGYIDRFVVAAVVSPAATGYYATPSDLVTRLSIISNAMMSSAYPAMAATFRTNPTATAVLFGRSIVTLTAALMMPALLVVAFSKLILTFWIGAAFASHAASAMCWLGVGVLLSGADSVVATLLDSIGEPGVNARFSLCEVILYVPLVAFMVHEFGIEGAAIAWTIRCLADFLCRQWLLVQRYPPVIPEMRRSVLTVLAGTTLVLLPLLGIGIVERSIAVVVGMCGFAVFVWFWGSTASERSLVFNTLHKVSLLKVQDLG